MLYVARKMTLLARDITEQPMQENACLLASAQWPKDTTVSLVKSHVHLWLRSNLLSLKQSAYCVLLISHDSMMHLLS